MWPNTELIHFEGYLTLSITQGDSTHDHIPSTDTVQSMNGSQEINRTTLQGHTVEPVTLQTCPLLLFPIPEDKIRRDILSG